MLASGLALGAEASAYCQTSSCEGGVTGSLCLPAQSTDCGIPIYWPQACIGFSMQQDASVQVPLDVAGTIFATAFSRWTSADCGGAPPSISVTQLAAVECAEHEYNTDEANGNANAIIFRDDAWPYGGKNTLALTTVTYNLETGEIRDADMELNSAQVVFTTGDADVGFDLLSVATHEAGHFIGLAHSPVDTATMQPDYEPGSVDLRDLDADDVQGVCAAYPPAAQPGECDPTPRGGFQSECGAPVEPEESGCCTVAAGATSRAGGPLPWGAVLGLVSLLAFAARGRRSPGGRA